MTQSQRLNAKWETVYPGQDLYIGSRHVPAEGYGIRVKKSEKRGYGEELIVIPIPGNEEAIVQRIVEEHNERIALERKATKSS